MANQKTFPRRFRAARPSLLAAMVLACALAVPNAASAQVVSNSSLYYRLGGGSPWGGSLNNSVIPKTLNLTLRLNYSCGKFDIGLSWTNLMNNLKQLGSQIEAAVQAGIAALPMYILQRANSGLFQLFQTFSAKADLLTAAALKTCEQMEREIKAGKNPYQEYIDMTKDLAWKYAINGSVSGPLASGGSTLLSSNAGGGDIVAAKTNINTNEVGQKNGIPWVYNNALAGGEGQHAIKPMKDITNAGYYSLLGLTPTDTNTSTAPPVSTPTNVRLLQTFPTADKATAWTTSALGDKDVYTCSQTPNCPSPNTGTPAAGLSPKLQDAITDITTNFDKALSIGDPTNDPKDYVDALAQIQVPGFAVTPELMERIRLMPAGQQAIARGRLIQELSIHRVINQALVARNIIIAGMTVPQAASLTKLQDDLHRQLNNLTQYIEDLMYEWRIRKEMTGFSATAIMNQADFNDARSSRQPLGVPVDEQAPFQNGAVIPRQ